MEKILLDLIQTVEIEKERYQDIYALSERKREVIIAGDANTLEDIVAQERKLEKEITQLEARREDVLALLAEKMQLPVEQVNITEISKRVSAELSQRLKNFQEEFLELLNKQMRVNEVNKLLLETQLHYTEVFLESLATSDNINNTYGYNGMDADTYSQRTGLIDHKI